MKTKVTISLEEDLWFSFRDYCNRNKTTASNLFEEFIKEKIKKKDEEK